jgi:hypothetical protein
VNNFVVIYTLLNETCNGDERSRYAVDEEGQPVYSGRKMHAGTGLRGVKDKIHAR